MELHCNKTNGVIEMELWRLSGESVLFLRLCVFVSFSSAFILRVTTATWESQSCTSLFSVVGDSIGVVY